MSHGMKDQRQNLRSIFMWSLVVDDVSTTLPFSNSSPLSSLSDSCSSFGTIKFMSSVVVVPSDDASDAAGASPTINIKW